MDPTVGSIWQVNGTNHTIMVIKRPTAGRPKAGEEGKIYIRDGLETRHLPLEEFTRFYTPKSFGARSKVVYTVPVGVHAALASQAILTGLTFEDFMEAHAVLLSENPQ